MSPSVKSPTKSAADAAAKTAEGFKVDLGQDTMTGFEGITQQTMAIPWLRILQKLSPQLDENVPEYIEGAKEGMLFNNVTKNVYGFGVKVISLKFERLYTEWRGKKKDRGGFVATHDPDNAERLAVDKSTWGEWLTAEGNFLQENYVYMVILADHPEDGIMILSLASSMIKTARQWNRMLTGRIVAADDAAAIAIGLQPGQRVLPYYMVWDMTTTRRENDQGAWFAPVVKFDGYVSKDLYMLATKERVALPSSRQIEATLSTDDQRGTGEEEEEKGF